MDLWTSAIDRAFILTRPMSVLDVGCGPFRDAPYIVPILERLDQDGRYLGVDQSPDAIARHRVAAMHDDRCSYHCGDFLDYSPASFDLVVTKCFVCLYYGTGRQDEVIARLRDAGRHWLFYDSFDAPDADEYLAQLGPIRFLHRECEMNPPYTRCGLISFR